MLLGRKSKHIRLQVILNGNPVGLLVRDAQGRVEFSYAEAWLAAPAAIPVSLSLPLRESSYRGAAVEAYFDNLLPDNEDIRRRIAEKMATQGRGTLDLLGAIGRDCVGALQFIPEGESYKKTAPLRAEPLSDRDIAQILRHLKAAPLGLSREAEFRISIAGAQEKTALLFWNDRWQRPQGMTPTTHILKPAMGLLSNGIDLSGSIENEWLCLKLARYFGLPVASAEIKNFDGVSCLIVERFDRVWSQDKKRLKRIPQEDLCQALGVAWSRKYQSDGGPGIVDIMNLLDASDRREQDREQFMRAQLVFFLLGAVDGHAKNFSIALSSTGFRLTPIYDVMTVLPALAARQIEPKQAKLAMSVGDGKHYRLGEIQRRHWEQTAKKTAFADLHSLIQDLLDRIRKIDDFANELEKNIVSPIMGVLLDGIKKQGKILAA
ncbi:MAG TPA: toxin HipA [Deltaproteobacteria bacterium]|nr:toxin HipA [Deltaproteobacteria bacterium]